ncbi:MAG: OmpA family protein [Gemmatimonadaceae bacterium]
MAATILDTLKSLIDQGPAKTLADRLGEDSQNVARGLHAGSTSILAGLANKTDDAPTMSKTFDLISKPEATTTAIADDVALAREGREPNEVGNMSARFLAELFGDRASMVNNVVADASGLSGQSTLSVMRFAVPLVLGFLGRHVRSSGLDQNGFTKILSDERNNIMRDAPPGLAGALGVESPRVALTDREIAFQSDRRTTASDYGIRKDQPNPSGNRWLWPTLATLAILALIWGAHARSHRMPAIDTTSAAGGEIAPAIAPPAGTTTPSTPAAPMASSGSISLPDGSTLSVPAGSIEARLAGFLVDSTQRTSDTTWFDFDRLTFENNSAKLAPQSSEQLDNIAKILKAYPNVAAKIGGYTDSTGKPAANMRLSSARASNVRAMLVKDGIASSRLSSEGYGAEHPEADNSTDAGRAQNRRIALLVVRK